MVSAAEQLAANFNLGSFAKAGDLKKRMLFTLGALIVYRLGTYIPLPGVDPAAMMSYFRTAGQGVLGMFDMFAGGALSRMTIFALSIMPYISASIIMQLFAATIPSMIQLKKQGEIGRRKINQYTRYGTVLIASVQAYGMAVGLERMGGGQMVLDPGVFFRISTVVTLLGGTMFLMWLGEQMTARGIGNGISLIITAGIVAQLPTALFNVLEAGRVGSLSTAFILGMLIVVVLVIAFIVFMERAQRRLTLHFPKRQVGNRMFAGRSSHLPLKLNTSGVIPPIFASSILLLPLTIVGFTSADGSTGFLAVISRYLQHGQPLYMVLYGALVAFFAFFYTSVVFSPQDTADALKRSGSFIPGIRPGNSTAEYIQKVLTRITVIGAAYLVVICLLPEFLMTKYSLPFYFGGTSLLIVVTVTMDTLAQVYSHLVGQQYEGLLKKSEKRKRRRS